ncbi:MAG: hypothetical protein M1351_02330 [Candidatus Thermoplasmatota archaeon]|nr:hypothetical protein [Candidatus Thermoplasmatota archaeon]
MGDMTDSKLAQFAVETASWAHEVNAEVEEAIGILNSAEMSDVWWAKRLVRNITAADGPSDDAAKTGDTANTLLEIAFWSGWLKGEQDTLNRLMGIVAMLMMPDGPHRTQAGKKSGKNDFLKGLR